MMTHPLVSLTQEAPAKAQACQMLRLSDDQVIFVMMPGSRDGEIKAHAPELAKIAKRLASMFTDASFIVPLAREEQVGLFKALWRHGCEGPPEPLVRVGNAQTMIAAADLAIVASGTATLQVALTGRPAVVIYRTHLLSYALAKRLVRVRHIALPNILLGKTVYPEFIQERLRTEPICATIADIMADRGRQQLAELAKLGPMLEGATDEEIVNVALGLA